MFAELFEKFPPPLPNDEVLRNYLIRSGFAPQAVSAVVLSYRETMDLVERESGGYPAASPDSEERPAMNLATPAAAPAAAPKPATVDTSFVSSNRAGTRDLGRWQFEDGTWVQILASEKVATGDALDMAEMLIKIRRAELGRRKPSLDESLGGQQKGPALSGPAPSSQSPASVPFIVESGDPRRAGNSYSGIASQVSSISCISVTVAGAGFLAAGAVSAGMGGRSQSGAGTSTGGRFSSLASSHSTRFASFHFPTLR